MLQAAVGKTSDQTRTPMQWTGDLNAGFTDHSKTWLPVHSNYPTVNVKVSRYTLVTYCVTKSTSLLIILRASATSLVVPLGYIIAVVSGM